MQDAVVLNVRARSDAYGVDVGAQHGAIPDGDVLLELDGRATESADDLLDLLTGSRVGQRVPARTLRGGAVRDVQITIAERK